MIMQADVRAWVGTLELWQVAQVALLLMVMLLCGRRLRRTESAVSQAVADPQTDSFGCIAPINSDEMQMLHFLQQAFAEEAVLFRPSLAQALVVRKSANRRRASAWLREQRVDYLVCGMDGQPVCAFDLDRTREHADEASMREAVAKKMLLHSAGLRLIRLRGSARHMPSPGELRERVLRDRTKPVVAGPSGFSPSAFGAPGHEPSKFGLSSFGHTTTSDFGSSGLGGRYPEKESVWADVRKRS